MTMRRTISGPLIAVVSDVAATRETHASLDSLFMDAGAPGDPPPGSKPAKAQGWLRRTNKDESIDPLSVLGRIIENYMDAPLDENSEWDEEFLKQRGRIASALERADLKYVKGGRIVSGLAAPAHTLSDYIRKRDLPALDSEFSRAAQHVLSSPREAVSAAGNILESTCKMHIEDNKLEMPSKQDLLSVWAVVRKHLGFDPSRIEDDDLKQILSDLHPSLTESPPSGPTPVRHMAPAVSPIGSRPAMLALQCMLHILSPCSSSSRGMRVQRRAALRQGSAHTSLVVP